MVSQKQKKKRLNGLGGYDLVVMISASQAGHTGSNPVTRIQNKSIGLTYRFYELKILL